MRMRYLVALLAALWAAPATAQLLAEGQDQRTLTFRVMDGKPFLPAQVGAVSGWMMLDNGTPETVFLNRHALDLGPAPEVGRGFAASGQEIVVWLHDALPVAVAGQPLPLVPKVTSGDFGFAEGAHGPDFLGFIGTPALIGHVFLLDYAAGRMTVFDPATAPVPKADDVLDTVPFAYWPGEQPTMAGLLGDRPLLVDLDTGDNGTIYLRPETKAALLAEGAVEPTSQGLVLKRLTLGATVFTNLPVAEVVAGGPQDMRPSGPVDFLRLGSAFLATQRVLWDFPARRLVFLTADAVYPPM